MQSPLSVFALFIKLVITFLFFMAIGYLLTGTIEPKDWNTIMNVDITILYCLCTVYIIFSHKETKPK